VKLDPSKTGIADYLSPRTHAIFVEPASLEEEFSLFADNADSSPPADGPTNPEASALPALLDKCAVRFGLADLDEASVLFDGAEREVTWDTESLVHHRSYPDDALVAQERLQVEDEARRRFLRQAEGGRGAARP
jgi:transcription-repair coupling factor (superfamily II helicase)